MVRKEIQIEGRTGKNYIVSGETLRANDRIVVSGLDKLTNGVKVNPMKVGSLVSNPATTGMK